MATIVARKRKNGSVAYMARIVVKRNGAVTHREARTFEMERHAINWAKRREVELMDAPPAPASPTLAEAIERYVRESRRDIRRTKAQCLRTLASLPIAGKRCSDIASHDIVSLARDLSASRQPATAANYLSHLSSVFAIARPAWGIPLDPLAMSDALKVAKRLGYISKSRHRDRRPTLEELDRLMEFFARRSGAPMTRIMAFAIFSTRRQEEIASLEWRDLDEPGRRVLVRDMKHPGQKDGNNVWCDLPPEALAIIRTMPRDQVRIFPHSADAISAAFTRACKVLGIEDLHFHDLRHEGVSRLFEIGLTIPHVAAVSGHRSWTSLRRYTHIRQTGDKYAAWEWTSRLSEPPPPDTPPADPGSAAP